MTDGAAPAWYPDPTQPGMQRYWDGSQWTGNAAPLPAPVAPTKTSGFAIAALIFGIAGGILFAIVFGFVARSQIKSSDGRLKGRGLATAGIVLGFVWLGLIALFVALGISGAFDTDNASNYSGEQKEIAQVVDDMYDALRDSDGVRVCTQLFTADFADLVADGSGQSCPDFVAEAGGRSQATITVKTIVIDGDTATVDVEEGGKDEVWHMVRQDGQWRIDDIQSE